jgi:predicted alpha/beta hydrolase family esterase
MAEVRNAYKTQIRRPEGKRPLARHRHKWVCNIKMDLKQGRKPKLLLAHKLE